jgi:hypothetical protein
MTPEEIQNSIIITPLNKASDDVIVLDARLVVRAQRFIANAVYQNPMTVLHAQDCLREEIMRYIYADQSRALREASMDLLGASPYSEEFVKARFKLIELATRNPR